MSPGAELISTFPRPLADYASTPGQSLASILRDRIAAEPFNAVATTIFVVAILHTFAAPRLTALAHVIQHRHDATQRAAGAAESPSLLAEFLHFLGEVEVVFGLWAVVLLFAIAGFDGVETARHYLNDTVNYTEPLFVIVVMALASTRPVVSFAENSLRRVANIGGGSPAAWWVAILTVGPIMGSFVTEPAAMTICALLLARQFYDLQPSSRLRYATLGLLFVNVSIGGTLTHFAAPPVLMVSRVWDWGTGFMLLTLGWRAVVAIVASTLVYLLVFRREMRELTSHPKLVEIELADEDAVGPGLLAIPSWLTVVHLAFLAWTVVNAHYPALFLGGFLFFLGFLKATAAYQSRLELRGPLLVGFFLSGLVIHGGLQAWWIAPVLGSLSRAPLFLGATILTTFNDNALITYLATLVPHLDEPLKIAALQGAVTGGGMTVIANAPNPAGQAILSRFFDDSVSPLWLAVGALLPTLIAAAAFRLL